MIAAALAVSAAAGLICGRESASPAPAAEEVRITEDTEAEILTKYLYCSHVVSADPAGFYGMDRNEFSEAFPGRIYEFGEKRCAR